MNRQELCIRFGWRFASEMPDVYISRSGMESKHLDEKFTQTELGSLKDDLLKMDQAAKIKDDRIRQLEESMRLLQQNFDAVSRGPSLNPTVADVERALRAKKQARPASPGELSRGETAS